MKYLFRTICAVAMLGAASVSQASIIDLPVNGNVAGSVTGDSAWLLENTYGDGLDYILFEVTEASLVDIVLNASIDFGLSLYSGTVGNEYGITFNNSGDFSDFFTDLTYITGSDPFVPGAPDFLTGISLTAGFYTLALGGSEGLMDTFNEYDYELSVDINAQVSPVSEPSIVLLMLFSMTGMFAVRRKLK
ncbi:PEP-CTERM sorting domain-containing protein [Paraglaciecola arctica]|uniref:PEP-CTERM sorting domain-containing protein n=1 Tax=Paraglaciecola arctica TaxID=1128911 RepID=UPI001C075556|nr:PEP-CTERM sorting domain-containing protein [Paraglaciecola arctica]MBU3002548.1 PEP-CTERM sorting domain-containing protein [Paraglaciecola arctica]